MPALCASSQLLTARGAGTAPSGLQPAHLAKPAHNGLDTSESQFTGNKRDLFSVKHPSFPQASQLTFRGCSCVGDTPPRSGFPPLEESKGQVAPTVSWGCLELVELLCLLLEGSWGSTGVSWGLGPCLSWELDIQPRKGRMPSCGMAGHASTVEREEVGSQLWLVLHPQPCPG